MTSRTIRRHSPSLTLTVILGAVGVISTSRPVFAALEQTPETLCASGAAASNAPKVSYEQFKARFGHRFKSEEEIQFAWRVYQAVHNTSATVVLGRLADTKSYVGTQGYCVLANLKPYSIALNDIFLYGGVDRGARFLLVSEPPREIMHTTVDLTQFEADPEKNWRVIYNHELDVLERYGGYDIPSGFKPPYLLESPKSANAQ